MAETNRHKVFISFQHGCTDVYRKCGVITSREFPGQTFFKDCNGHCGRNRNFPETPCVFYYKCGQYWKERFEFLMAKKTDKMISRSVGDGDIEDGLKTETTRQKIRDEFIADASVTIVLIGPETWKRKHVDWEISSSIKDTKNNPRCGLIGILLPTYPDFNKEKNTYYPYTIPPRLYYNIKNEYATIHVWNENTDLIQMWIHEAFIRKDRNDIDNVYPMFGKNRPDNQSRWQP